MAEGKLVAPEAEQAVLGAILQDGLALERVRAVISAEDFADKRHAHVFAAMLELAQAGREVDHLTLSERLKAAGVLAACGGPAYLMRLDQAVPVSHRAPEHAREVRDLSIRRRAIAVARGNAAMAEDLGRELDSVLTEGARAWAGLTHAVKGVRRGDEHLQDLINDMERAQKGELEPCIPTGIDRWDEVFGGLQPGKLTFLGSLPGVGKSSVMASMLDNLGQRRRKVGLFSLEDLGRWLPRRLLSKRASVPLFVLAMRPLTPEQMRRINEAAPQVHLDVANIVIDERSMLTPAQIVQTARDMVVNEGAEALFIDHLGKVDFESRKHHAHDLAIEHGLNELTALAKDYNLPILIAAHLKERDKDAKYQRPDLESFARTAYIGRDARVAVGLYLDRDNPDVLNVAVLKQTEGEADADFQLRRLKECGMVASRNGELRTDSYKEAEARMLGERAA